VHDNDPRLAAQCYRKAAGLLVKKRDYDLCLYYLGDPEKAYRVIHQWWERMKEEEKQRSGRNAQPLKQENSFRPPEPPSFADNAFVQDTCQLIEILVGTNLKAEAEKIRDLAVRAVDDPRLKSAVSDAETTIRR
jgi:hypothetical protein